MIGVGFSVPTPGQNYCLIPCWMSLRIDEVCSGDAVHTAGRELCGCWETHSPKFDFQEHKYGRQELKAKGTKRNPTFLCTEAQSPIPSPQKNAFSLPEKGSTGAQRGRMLEYRLEILSPFPNTFFLLEGYKWSGVVLAFSIPLCFSRPRQHRECCAAGSERAACLHNEKQGTQQPLWMEQQFAGQAAVGQKASSLPNTGEQSQHQVGCSCWDGT